MPDSIKFPSATMRLIRQFAIASFVVLLYFLSLIRIFTDSQNRFFFGWHRNDGISLITTVLMLSVAALISYRLALLLQRKWVTRITQHLFLAILFLGVYSCSYMLLKQHPNVRNLMGIMLIAIWVYSFASTKGRVLRFSSNACLIFSPLVAILFVQILSWPSWESNRGPANPTKPPVLDAIPVYMFVFDEWSYLRSTDAGEFRPFWKNLNRLCEQAIVLRDARSPADNTSESIPKFLFQTNKQLVKGKGRIYWEENGQRKLTTSEESLFALAKRHEYNTAVVGFFVPYRTLLGDQVDYVYGNSFANKYGPVTRGNMIAQIKEWTALAIGKQKNPLSSWLHDSFNIGQFSGRVGYNRHRQRLVQVEKILNEYPSNSMAFAHLVVPHAPYIFDADGKYWPTDDLDPMSPDPDGYVRHLRYVDHLIGEFVATLKETGKFENALIIFTSDHSWRYDPNRPKNADPDTVRWVPLIIKCPGQTRRVTIDRRFTTNQLRSVVELALRSKAGSDLTDEMTRFILAETLLAADGPAESTPESE